MSGGTRWWWVAVVSAWLVAPQPSAAQWIVDPDASVTTVPYKYERSPAIAACGDTLVAVWWKDGDTTFGRHHANYGYSVDGGRTWRDGDGFARDSIESIEPAVCASRNGTFYVVVKWSPPPYYQLTLAVFRGRLNAGTLEWDGPHLALPYPTDPSGGYESPSIACDDEGSRVYLAYTAVDPAAPSLNRMVSLVWSSDSARTWTEYVMLGSYKSSGASVTVDEEGRVVVAWQEHQLGTMVARRSEPCGAGGDSDCLAFGPTATIAESHDNAVTRPVGVHPLGWDPILICGKTYHPNYSRLALDRSGRGRHGSMYVVWAAGCEGTPAVGSGRTVNEVEDNDFYATATPIEIGDDIVGSADPEGSQDFYEMFKFHGERGTTIYVWSTNTSPLCQRWTVYSGDDTALVEVNDGTAGGLGNSPAPTPEYPAMILTLPRTGTYYLRGTPPFSLNTIRYRTRVRGFEVSPASAARDMRDIVLSASHDGGQTWTAPVRVNDDPPWWDNSLASVAVDGEGVVHVVWYGRTEGEPWGGMVDAYWAYSTDGGATFSPSVPVSWRSSRWGRGAYGVGSRGPGDVGTHLAVAASRSAVHALWTQDTRVETPFPFDDGDIYHARIHRDTTTAVLLSRLTVTREGECARVAWEFGRGVGVAEVCVVRAVAPGQEEEVGCVTDDAVSGAVCDATAGVDVAYRLRVRFTDGRTRWFGPVSMASGATPTPPLRVQPNPARGSVRLSVDGARFGDPLTVDVLDTSGRRVARLHRGSAAGRLDLEWDGRDGDRRVARGIYFVECRGPHGSIRGKVVVLDR